MKCYVQVFIEVCGWFVQLGQPLEANFGSLFLEDAFVISRPPGQGGLSSWGVASQFAAVCSRTWGRCGWPHVNHVGGVVRWAVAGMIPPTAVLVGRLLLQLTCQLFCKKRGNVASVPDLNWAGNQTDKHGGLVRQKSFGHHYGTDFIAVKVNHIDGL